VRDRFETHAGAQVWDTWDDFARDDAGRDLARYRRLCPAWAFEPPEEER
jgi:hypothetical protein